MKVFLALVALVSFASSADIDDLEACKLFLECCRKAMDGGVPSISIPNHNPLSIRNIASNDSDFSYNITDNILYNLIDYNVTSLTATSYTNPDRIAFWYNVYWPKLNFTGNYELDIPSLSHSHFQGSYNIVLREVNWSGIFNLTKPGQRNVKEHLDDFTINSNILSVEVTLSGLDTVTVILEYTLEVFIFNIMAHFPPTVADYLKEERFNGFWFAHPEKIDQLIAFCQQ